MGILHVHVVSAACRLPGGIDEPDALASALDDPSDAIGPPPAWRGFDAFAGDGPGQSYQLRGGWLTRGVRDFDPEPFGLNAREARDLDPQQRLLLRCTRDAFDRAQVDPADLGTVGVWVGISGSEYKVLAQRRGAEAISPYIGTGTHPAAAAGRLAYTFGLQGPAVAIDTACSSSLVALHHAVQAIRRGEVDAAVVAGVNVLLDPEAHVSMASMGTLSRSGACHSWSAAADGYVRSEGCVVLLLTSDASLPRWGTLEGSACNQDGRSSGLTAPRREAQVAVLRAALAQAGLAPDAIGYHEGHGSATPLGDGVEIAGLGEVYGERGAGAPPVALGSVKARLGHLEAAAGLAGVLHALVIARRGVVPAMPHAQPAAPALSAHSASLVVPTAPRPLLTSTAAICGFGIGGTNAAVVLTAAPSVVPEQVADEAALVVWSGSSEGARAEQQRRLGARLVGEPVVGVGAATRRGLAGRWRGAAWVRPGHPDDLERGVFGVASGPPEMLWAAPGQGVGAPGLGRSLYEAHPMARETLDEAFAVADELLGRSLADRLWRDGEALWSDMPALQVGVSAVSVAWGRTLMAHGLTPTAVMGHSSGEWAAAVLAGVVSLSDAVRVLVARGQLLEQAGDGAMWAVFAPETAVRDALRGEVGIAAVNHEAEVVVSGPPGPTREVAEALAATGFEVRHLPVHVAGHSALLDGALSNLEDVVRGVALQRPTIEFLSTSTGDWVSEELTDPGYWSRQFRQPVRLQAALAVARDEGLAPVVELGPRPMMARAARVEGLAAVCTGDREQAASESLGRALGALWVHGAPVAPPPPSASRKPPVGWVPRRLWLHGVSFSAGRWEEAWRMAVLGAARPGLQVLRPASGSARDEVRAVRDRLASWLEQAPCAVVAVLDPACPAHHAVAGWLRSVRWERPDWGVSLVWSAAGVSDEVAATVPAGEELRRVGEGWEAVRFVAQEARSGSPAPWAGHWVITGGFGALGMHTAEWLVRRGVTELTLVGRRGCPDHRRARVDALASEVVVHEVAADIAADWTDQLEAAVAGAQGVIHGAGTLQDAAFWRVTDAQLDAVFAAKVSGADKLLAALEERPDAWFVAYSSLTGAAGGAGQGAYGAANAWLDAAVARRGGRSLSVAWGPWEGEGLAADTLDRRTSQGLPPMGAAEALEALDEAMRSGTCWVAIADLQRDAMADVLESAPQPRWQELVPVDPSWRVDGSDWRDHQVGEAAWISAADQLVWALTQQRSLADVRWTAPLVLPSEGEARGVWRDHSVVLDGARGLVARSGVARPRAAEFDPPAGEDVDLDALYASFRARGVVHGAAYRRVVAGRRAEGVVSGRAEGGTTGQRLDGLLSLAAVWAEGDRPLVPARAAAVQAIDGWASLCQVRLLRRDGDPLVADVVAADGEGRPVLWIDGLRWAAVGGEVATPSAAAPAATPWVGLDEEARRARLLEVVSAACIEVLELRAVDVDRDLAEQGLDSILALELRDRLRRDAVDIALHRVVGGASPRDLVRAAEEALGPVAAAQEDDRGPAPTPLAGGAEAMASEASTDWMQGWWWTPFFLGALVGATLWALVD